MQSRLFQTVRTRATALVFQRQRQPTAYPISNLRTTTNRPFSSTPTFFAAEAPRSPFEAPYSEASVPLFDRLQQHPQALAAIENLAKLCKEKTGVDLAGGGKPSMALMYSLASDPELRTAAELLMKSLADAGIKIDPTQAFQALKTMGGPEFDQAGGLEDLSNEINVRGKKGDGEGGDGEGSGKK